MDHATFWAIVDASLEGAKHDDTGQLQLRAFGDELRKLTPDEIVEFQRVFNDLMDESYRADHWGAAYLINGGCSDDSFDYFRNWLISRGRKVYDEALAKPDALARYLDVDDAGFEEFAYVPPKAYEARTGEDISAFYDRVEAGRPHTGLRELVGDLADWSGPDGDIDEAKAKKLYPKLYRKFWD